MVGESAGVGGDSGGGCVHRSRWLRVKAAFARSDKFLANTAFVFGLTCDRGNLGHRDIEFHRDIDTPLHQKHPTSESYTSNTECDTEEMTFQADSSMCGAKEFIKESRMAAVVKITKGTE